MSTVMKALPAPGHSVFKSGGNRLGWLMAGGLLLVGVLWYAAPEDSGVVEPSSSRATAAGAASTAAGENSPANVAFAPRATAKAGVNLFESRSWYIAPPPPPPPPPPVAVAPSAPPLPYTFLGSYVKSGDKPVYFLVRGDRVYDVRPGDVVENTYAVGTVSRGQLQLTYLPLKQDQWLSVGSPQ